MPSLHNKKYSSVEKKPKRSPLPWGVDCWGLINRDWSIEDASHTDIARGLSLEDAELIVKAVNSYQALLKAAKNALAAHENEIDCNGQVYTNDIELRKAIALAEGKE